MSMASSTDGGLDDDVPPIDLTGAVDQHLYPVEEEDEEEANMSNEVSSSSTAGGAAANDTDRAAATRQLPTANSASAANRIENTPNLPASGIAAPPNAVAPSSFAPPAYVEGDSLDGDPLFSYSLPHSSLEHLLPSESRSSSRRSCHRHRSRSRTRNRLFPFIRFPRRFRRFWRLKRKERNVAAAAGSVLVIAFLLASLVLPSWFELYGGACKRHHLGALDFFRLNAADLTQTEEGGNHKAFEIDHVMSFKPEDDDGIIWGDCVTSEILTLMRVVIVFVFCAICFTCCAFVLDASGAQSSPYKYFRRHGVGNILTVLFCVVINGFAYWVSTLIRVQQSANKTLAGKKIVVTFDVSFYLVVGAGGLSVVATAANLLKQHPTEEEEQISRLIDCDENDDDGDDGDDGLLQRRMRSRGDLSSLCDAHSEDTFMSMYPRSMRTINRPPPGISVPVPAPQQTPLLLSSHQPCSQNLLPPPYTP